MFTQRCRDAITVTCTTRQFNHFTSEHYKVSKSVVKAWYLRKLYLQPIFESLLMTCAKNCFKKLVDIYVKPIASQTWDIFSRHSVHILPTVYCMHPYVRLLHGCFVLFSD